jgi:DME family drug/metabolite transporter
VAVVLAASLWGTTGTAQQLGPDSSTSLGVGALRLLIGGAALVLFAAWAGGLRAQPWRSVAVPLLVGAIFVAIYQLAFFEATRRAGVAAATVITIASAPVFSTVIALARRVHRPSRVSLAATAITIVGVALLGSSAASGSGTSPASGVAFSLLSGLGYACYAELGRVAIDRGMHSTTSMAALFCGGALIASLTLPWQPLGWVTTGAGALMLVHLAVVTLGLGYALYGWGLARLPVPTVVTLTLAEPVVAALLAVLVLDEVLPLRGWLGITIVVAGLGVAGRDAAASPDVPEAPLPSTS